jgi:hypothetical protein
MVRRVRQRRVERKSIVRLRTTEERPNHQAGPKPNGYNAIWPRPELLFLLYGSVRSARLRRILSHTAVVLIDRQNLAQNLGTSIRIFFLLGEACGEFRMSAFIHPP